MPDPTPLTIPALHKLSDKITEDMLEHYCNGLCLREIAEIYQTTVGSVRNRIKDLANYEPRPKGNQRTK